MSADVEPDGARDAGRDLGDLEGVGEARAHVVIGEDEDLGLAGEAAKGARVQDAVAVALETGAELVGLFLARSVSRRRGSASHRWRAPRRVALLARRGNPGALTTRPRRQSTPRSRGGRR